MTPAPVTDAFGWPSAVIGVLMLAAYLYLHTELPKHADRIGEAYRLRSMNQGRRASDRERS